MTTLPFNMFDAIILSVLGLSALIAFFRGFIRELLSLGAWVGAAIVTLYLFPHTTNFMKHHMKSDHMAGGVAALGTYIIALLAFSILNSIIIRYVKKGSDVGLLDNFLGLGFGLVRGGFILSLAFLIMMGVISKDNPPEWLKTSITKPYLQEGGDLLVTIAPKYLGEVEAFVKHETGKEEEKPEDASAKPADAPAAEPNYGVQNRNDLNRLIDSISPPTNTTNTTEPAPSHGY